MLAFLTAVFLAIHAADLALTLRGLAIGKKERNPLARLLMRRLGWVQGLVFLKAAILACFFLLTVQLPALGQAAVLAASSLLGLAVVLNNLRVLQRAKKPRC
jgi:hypothetical protein